MLRISTILVAVGLIFSNPETASAQTGARFKESVNGWVVEDFKSRCSMVTGFDGPGALQVFYARDVDGTGIFMMSNTSWSFAENVALIPTFEFEGGKNLRSYARTTSTGPDRKAYYFKFDKQTSDLIAAEWVKSSKVRVTHAEQELATFSLAGAPQAAAALDRCLSVIRLGQSTAAAPVASSTQPARPAPRTLPSSVPGYLLPRATPLSDPASWQTFADYPVAARREGRQGATSASVTIGTDGRVQKCEIVESSGSSDLDAATCSVLRRSGRWRNAKDAQGRNLVSAWAVRMRWQLSN